jgi:thymidine kinase
MHLEVVLGPMFSGKSSYIHTAIRRRNAIGMETLVIKPEIDTRHFVVNETATHDGVRIPCRTVDRLSIISSSELAHVKFIVIEEAQFFNDLISWFKEMEQHCSDKSFLVIGLAGDSERKPFGRMLEILPYADSIVHMTAFCMECRNGTPGLFSFRQMQNEEQIAIGGANDYKTLCRACYLRESSYQMPNSNE